MMSYFFIICSFVNFMCEPDAEQAIKEMNGFQFNSTRLVVRRQEPRKKYVFT